MELIDLSISTDKDVLRTDRELEMYNDVTSTKLTQLENILRTYVMYNFDLGKWGLPLCQLGTSPDQGLYVVAVCNWLYLYVHMT